MIVVVLASAVITGSLGLKAPHQSAVPWLHLAVVVGLAVLLFTYGCLLARPERAALAEQVLQPVSFWRQYMAVSLAVQRLFALALSVGLLAMAEEDVGNPGIAGIFSTIFMALLFVAGVVDLIQNGAMLARRVWREMLGKLFSVSFGAVLLSLAIAKAKTWVHAITHIDPKYLTESTAILTAIFLPVMYCLFAMCLLSLLTILQLLGLAVYVIKTLITDNTRLFIGHSNYERVKLWWYRFITGSELPDGEALSKGIFDDLAIFVRPISTVAVIVVFMGTYTAAKGFLPKVWPYLTSALVALEYRHGSSCLDLEKNLGVVYMEDENISVVRKGEAGPIFSVEKCNFHVDAAGS